GIVYVNRGEMFEADDAIEVAERFPCRRGGADVVAGGVNVRGIYTNADPFRFANVLYNISDLLEPMTKAGALAGRSFKRDLRSYFWNSPKYAVDRGGNLLETRFFTRAEVGAGVHHKQRKLELVRPNSLFGKCSN